jgi:hypothetical protein
MHPAWVKPRVDYHKEIHTNTPHSFQGRLQPLTNARAQDIRGEGDEIHKGVDLLAEIDFAHEVLANTLLHHRFQLWHRVHAILAYTHIHTYTHT